MTRPIRLFMLFEAATFIVAASIHSGLLFSGYEHREAGIAESVIGIVLVTGLGLTYVRPRATRQIGLVAQGFALLGTLVGIFTIVIGVGPRTLPDIVYHVGIVAVLIWGLVVTARSPAAEAGPRV